MMNMERGMMMYKAVGWHSQNEYMAGNSLADVMRSYKKSTQHLDELLGV